MIVLYGIMVNSNSNRSNHSNHNLNHNRHNIDDIIIVVKAVARKSILMQITKIRAASLFH
jgi:hypothetical protein